MKPYPIVLLIVFSCSLLWSQAPDLYTAGEYPCNGKDLWEALKIAGCSDGSCEVYTKALKTIEEKCNGGDKSANEINIDNTYRLTSNTPINPKIEYDFCPYQDLFVDIEDNHWVVYSCRIDNGNNCKECLIETKLIFSKIPIPEGQTTGNSTKVDIIPILINKNISEQKFNPLIPFDFYNYYNGWANGALAQVYAEFKFVVSGRTKMYLLTQHGSIELSNYSVEFFKKNINTNFIYPYSMIFAADPQSKLLLAPSQNNKKAVLSGLIDGIPYLIGLDTLGTYYTPINLIDNAKNGQRLMKSIISSEELKHFIINDLMQSWFEGGNKKYIIAYQNSGIMKSYTNPESIFRSVETSPVIANPTNLVFLIEERSGDREIYIQGINISKQETFYKEVQSLANPWLALMAIADPGIQIKAKNKNIIGILTSMPDDIYVISTLNKNSIPASLSILQKSLSKDFCPIEAQKSRINNKYFNKKYYNLLIQHMN